MGFDRRQEPGGQAGGAGPTSHSPGKQTLVASVLEGAGSKAELAPGKQTRVSAELEALDPVTMQRKAHAADTGEPVPPPQGGGGAPLRPDLRAMMEAALGGSFGAVRVHQDPYAQAIGALAFTRGNDVFFAPGQFNPETPQGLELLGHELGHVKQQAEGRVPVNTQIGGAPANDDPALEHEADALGAKAARGGAARGAGGAPGQPASGAPAAPANHATLQAKAPRICRPGPGGGRFLCQGRDRRNRQVPDGGQEGRKQARCDRQDRCAESGRL